MRKFVSPLIKLVIFLVVTSFATYVLATTIANTSYGATTTYQADFGDVSNLQVGDDVRIAGVRVGTVSNIAIVKQDGKDCRPDQGSFCAQVSFQVANSRPLPASTRVAVRYRNLIGQRYLDVSQGAGASTKMLGSDQVIPTAQTTPAVDLTVLFAGFKPLFQGLDADQINQLSTEIIQTLQGEGGSLELLLSTLADLTNSVADKDHLIGEVIDNLTNVLTTVGNRDSELSNLIIQLQGFISGLAKDRHTIGGSISGINRLATSTAGLLTRVRAPLAKDIKDVTGLVGVLNHNSAPLTYVLQQLPGTVGALVRTASYGSWFNFYLCSVNGTITLPGGKILDLHNLSSQPAGRNGGRCD